MTTLDLVAGQVTLRCPACGTTEVTDPAVLAGSPRIVCRNCGETWPAKAGRGPQLALARSDTAAGRDSIHLSPQTFTAQGEGLSQAWAAKIEDDAAPASRPLRRPYASAALGALVFACLFFSGRDIVVAAVPDLAGLYAAAGFPVNLAGLAIEEVVAERSGEPSGSQLTVRGTIRNIAGANRPVPPLMAEIMPEAGGPSALSGFDPPMSELAPGGSASFVLRLDRAPPQALSVAVRFRRPAEAWSSAGDIAAR